MSALFLLDHDTLLFLTGYLIGFWGSARFAEWVR